MSVKITESKKNNIYNDIEAETFSFMQHLSKKLNEKKTKKAVEPSSLAPTSINFNLQVAKYVMPTGGLLTSRDKKNILPTTQILGTAHANQEKNKGATLYADYGIPFNSTVKQSNAESDASAQRTTNVNVKVNGNFPAITPDNTSHIKLPPSSSAPSVQQTQVQGWTQFNRAVTAFMSKQEGPAGRTVTPSAVPRDKPCATDNKTTSPLNNPAKAGIDAAVQNSINVSIKANLSGITPDNKSHTILPPSSSAPSIQKTHEQDWAQFSRAVNAFMGKEEGQAGCVVTPLAVSLDRPCTTDNKTAFPLNTSAKTGSDSAGQNSTNVTVTGQQQGSNTRASDSAFAPALSEGLATAKTEPSVQQSTTETKSDAASGLPQAVLVPHEIASDKVNIKQTKQSHSSTSPQMQRALTQGAVAVNGVTTEPPALELNYKFHGWTGDHSVRVSLPVEDVHYRNLLLQPSGSRVVDILNSQLAHLTSHTPKLLEPMQDSDERQQRHQQDNQDEEAE